MRLKAVPGERENPPKKTRDMHIPVKHLANPDISHYHSAKNTVKSKKQDQRSTPFRLTNTLSYASVCV